MALPRFPFVASFGTPLSATRGALVLLHGRGASGEDIAGLAEALPPQALAFFAPSAKTGAWYPERFFAPLDRNEPQLSEALAVVDACVNDALHSGIPIERVGLIGFSQGACLALEYFARNPQRYGLVAALSGALIGPLDTPRLPADFHSTPVLLGCAEADPHIPVEYVEHTAVLFQQRQAEVTKQIFRGRAHTVFPEEIAWLTERLQNWQEF